MFMPWARSFALHAVAWAVVYVAVRWAEVALRRDTFPSCAVLEAIAQRGSGVGVRQTICTAYWAVLERGSALLAAPS